MPGWDRDDRIKFATNNGWGIGKYITDLGTLGGQDAIYDPSTGTLRALPVSSAYVGYERKWRQAFVSAFTYGIVNVANLDIQPDNALKRTQRTSFNVTWSPVPQADVARGVSVRHARQQEQSARHVESDPGRLDLPILNPRREQRPT